MRRVWLLGSVLLLLLVGWVVGPAGASTGGAPQTQPPASPTLSTTLFKTFSSKSGGGTTVRVSTDGNVIGFESPTGLDHIDAGIVAEGYVLCYTNPNNAVKVNAYDVASTASGFGPSTDIASPVSVTRTTSDGILRLAQAFKFNGAGRSLQVTMTLTNISGLTVTGIGLRRQVDIDADAGGANGTGNFDNLFGATSSSVFAYNDSGGGPTIAPGEHGLMLRSLYTKLGSKGYGPMPGSATSTFDDTGCVATVDQSPVGPVDDGATFNMLPIVSLAPGGTMTEVIEFDSI